MNIAKKAVIAIMKLKKLCFIFLTNIETALPIKTITAARIPLKNASRALFSLKVDIKIDIPMMIKKEGREAPSVATIAPGIPATLPPIKVATFMAIGPGLISEIVKISERV